MATGSARFVVVGAKFLQVRPTFVGLEAGSVRTLKPEPTNPHDSYAVGVYYGGTKLGFVPNRGHLCLDCKATCRSGDLTCNHCGSDAIEKGGLAKRLALQLVFEDSHVCKVTLVDLGSHTPVHAEIWSVKLI